MGKTNGSTISASIERRVISAKGLGLGQPIVRPLELDGAAINCQLGNLAREILGNALLDLKPREV